MYSKSNFEKKKKKIAKFNLPLVAWEQLQESPIQMVYFVLHTEPLINSGSCNFTSGPAKQMLPALDWIKQGLTQCTAVVS